MDHEILSPKIYVIILLLKRTMLQLKKWINFYGTEIRGMYSIHYPLNLDLSFSAFEKTRRRLDWKKWAFMASQVIAAVECGRCSHSYHRAPRIFFEREWQNIMYVKGRENEEVEENGAQLGYLSFSLTFLDHFSFPFFCANVNALLSESHKNYILFSCLLTFIFHYAEIYKASCFFTYAIT